MATFYSIHAYDQESKYYHGEDRIHCGKLYITFEKACEVIERKIQAHIEYFNSEEEVEVFRPPNRDEMKRKMDMSAHVHYYETYLLWLWVISKWEVEEEKPKKYVYQYFVEKEIRGTMVGLKASEKYASFDEMLDILESEVRNWVPYSSRQTIQEYMERNVRMVYNRVDDGSDDETITYVIHKYDA